MAYRYSPPWRDVKAEAQFGNNGETLFMGFSVWFAQPPFLYSPGPRKMVPTPAHSGGGTAGLSKDKA